MRRPVLPEGFENHDFIEAYRREANPRKRVRLLGPAHLQEGKDFTETGRILKVNRQTVSGWLCRFTEDGFEGLADADRSGPETRLRPEQELCFQQAVIELQEERNGGRADGRDIQDMLLNRFAAKYTLSGVYALLKRLNMVWITCRSKHPKSDEQAQRNFKKTSPKLPHPPCRQV